MGAQSIDPGRKIVGGRIAKAQLDENVVAHNLTHLTNCFILLSQSSGKQRTYCLNKEIIEPLSELLEFHVDKYCPGLTKCVPADKLKEYMKTEAAKPTYIEHE